MSEAELKDWEALMSRAAKDDSADIALSNATEGKATPTGRLLAMLSNRSSVATLSVFLLAAATIYSVDRGVFIGTSTVVEGKFLTKSCRYLFITGVSERPARGGFGDHDPRLWMHGVRSIDGPDDLYCRIFAD